MRVTIVKYKRYFGLKDVIQIIRPLRVDILVDNKFLRYLFNTTCKSYMNPAMAADNANANNKYCRFR